MLSSLFRSETALGVVVIGCVSDSAAATTAVRRRRGRSALRSATRRARWVVAWLPAARRPVVRARPGPRHGPPVAQPAPRRPPRGAVDVGGRRAGVRRVAWRRAREARAVRRARAPRQRRRPWPCCRRSAVARSPRPRHVRSCTPGNADDRARHTVRSSDGTADVENFSRPRAAARPYRNRPDPGGPGPGSPGDPGPAEGGCSGVLRRTRPDRRGTAPGVARGPLPPAPTGGGSSGGPPADSAGPARDRARGGARRRPGSPGDPGPGGGVLGGPPAEFAGPARERARGRPKTRPRRGGARGARSRRDRPDRKNFAAVDASAERRWLPAWRPARPRARAAVRRRLFSRERAAGEPWPARPRRTRAKTSTDATRSPRAVRPDRGDLRPPLPRSCRYAPNSRPCSYAPNSRPCRYAPNSRPCSYAPNSRPCRYAPNSRPCRYAPNSRPCRYAPGTCDIRRSRTACRYAPISRPCRYAPGLHAVNEIPGRPAPETASPDTERGQRSASVRRGGKTLRGQTKKISGRGAGAAGRPVASRA